jgi:hypothetical protein
MADIPAPCIASLHVLLKKKLDKMEGLSKKLAFMKKGDKFKRGQKSVQDGSAELSADYLRL